MIDRSEGRTSHSARVRGPYQVIDEAYLAPQGQGNPSADYDEPVLQGMARALWVTSYADWAFEHRDEPGVVIARGGEDWADVAPEPPGVYPDDSLMAARTLQSMYEEANRSDIKALLVEAARADGLDVDDADELDDEYAETFGHYLAMSALGHGVSWFDDHAQFELTEPTFEAWYDGENLEWSPGPATRPNPALTAARRHALADKDFAVPENEGLPIDTANRARAAMARFNQYDFDSAKQRRRAFRRIVAKARNFGIDPSGFVAEYGGR